jgi:hypothetical protein
MTNLVFTIAPGLHYKVVNRDENGTEIFRTDRFRFLYYEPFFNMKNCQFQLVSQPFSTIFCTL